MGEENKEYQKAVSYLTRMIENGELRSDSRLPAERTIAADLNISRNSTREALRSLENMGIIESRHGSGSYLTGNISKSLSTMIKIMMMLEKFSESEICEFRRSMEKTVCFTLLDSRADKEKIADEAYSIITAPQQTAGDETEADRRFHYYLIEATQNRLLISIMEAITDIYREWIDSVISGAPPELRARLADAHLDIISAIRKSDRAECEKAIDRHYDLTDEVMLSRK
ncbi:MAG: GntR family transcriptional regulator [Oscillospiraceae bacterium]|nr:GntR family transcriptional regulator [Oscillospiraceae bacterium]